MGYLNLVGSFIYKEPLFRSKLTALANNDAQLKTDGWAQSSKTLFYQTTVPIGWTQDISQNDKALRMVGSTGGGGSGGTAALSSTITTQHTHAITSDDSHTHAYSDHTHFLALGSGSAANSFQYIYKNAGGLFRGYSFTPGLGSLVITPVTSKLATPGAITLGTLAAHNHGGATDQRLSNVALAYCDVLIGTKNANAGTYTDLTSYWHTGDKIDFDPFISYANNDVYNYGVLMPAASISLFVQPSAPTGWTKISSTDDRMLRVVNGTGGGTGGAQPISSGITLAHIHVLTTTLDHTHSIPNHLHALADAVSSTTVIAVLPDAEALVQDNGAGTLVKSASSGTQATRTCYLTSTTSSGAGFTGAAGGHAHSIPSQLADIQFAYVDVIQCSKDSSGSPDAYTDMTSSFAWKNLVSKQRLNNLAKNDSYIQYHTTPTGTGMLFFMASPPSGWTKITTQHDKALRIVSGGSGGTPGGGAHLFSSVISLAHAHTIVTAGGHTHAIAHTHPLDTSSQSNMNPASTQVIVGSSSGVDAGTFIAGLQAKVPLATASDNPIEAPTADPDHNHGGSTDSKLTDVSLAYADVIWCVKA